MNKVGISLLLLCMVALYVAWHKMYRPEGSTINTVDNLAIDNQLEAKMPFLWLRESYLTKDNTNRLVETKKECFSLYELKSLYSSERDLQTLAQFCGSNVENLVNGYKISAECQNQSARFYVDIEYSIKHAKWHEWQQTIFDINQTMIQQERIIFQQQGTCDVTN